MLFRSAKVKCYGADNVPEGVAIMKLENVSVSITGNSTNPTRFQHPVAGTYKKWCVENGKKYFSVASGGGTGSFFNPLIFATIPKIGVRPSIKAAPSFIAEILRKFAQDDKSY